MPPRTLKAPMGVWFSCLTTTSTLLSALSKGQAYCGVGGTLARTNGSTFSSSASVNIKLFGECKHQTIEAHDDPRRAAAGQHRRLFSEFHQRCRSQPRSSHANIRPRMSEKPGMISRGPFVA